MSNWQFPFSRVALEGSPQRSLGLRQNWRQFALLVLTSAFVGGMVGLERSVLPILAAAEFGLASASAALSFIVTFGITKALTNLAAGSLVDRFGRKKVLVAGWLFALPVPVVVLLAPSWGWIVAANTLLGINQGLTWSTTVIMKIDLVGPRRRGLAMGLNEFAGYLALAVTAYGSARMGTTLGLRAGPAYMGLAIAAIGLLLSTVFVRESMPYALLEADTRQDGVESGTVSIRSVLARSLWSDARFFSVSQAGLVNNLNDGLAWGLFPLVFSAMGLGLSETGILVALYPATWGLSQVLTGSLSDRLGRKPLIVGGMLVQGASLISMSLTQDLRAWVVSLVGLGIGTALVYPTLLAAASDLAPPAARGVTLGVYRMWRDLGYVVGALLAGVLADAFSTSAAIGVVGGLTVISGLAVVIRLRAHAASTAPTRGALQSVAITEADRGTP